MSEPRNPTDNSVGQAALVGLGGTAVGMKGMSSLNQALYNSVSTSQGPAPSGYAPKWNAELTGTAEKYLTKHYPQRTAPGVFTGPHSKPEINIRPTGPSVITLHQANPSAAVSKSFFFHELGHAAQNPKQALRILKLNNQVNKYTRPASAFAAAVGAGHDNENVRKAALVGAGVLSLPGAAHLVGLEADAWRRGGKMMRSYVQDQGKTFSRSRFLATAARPLGTYAAATVGIPLLAYGAGRGYRVLRNRTQQPSPQPSEEQP